MEIPLQNETSFKKWKRHLIVRRNISWANIQKYLKIIRYKFWVKPKFIGESAWKVLIKLGVGAFCKEVSERVLYLPPLYEIYIELNEPSSSTLKRLKRQQQKISDRPLISLLLHAQEWKLSRIRKSIQSVVNQVYPEWELLISIPTPFVEKLNHSVHLEFGGDHRIRVEPVPENAFKAEGLSISLQKARGAYIATMDSGDVLSPITLYKVVEALQDEPADLLYTDEDTINDFGIRQDPFFKPDWSPDLVYSINYVRHLAIYRREFILALGGFRLANPHMPEYDLLLRTAEQTTRIKHIPGILYHRHLQHSTSMVRMNHHANDGEHEKRVIQMSLNRQGIEGEVTQGLLPQSWRIKRALSSTPLISIIIPFKDQADVLKICLDSLFEKTTYQHYEVVLVDNASLFVDTKEYLRSLRDRSNLRVLSYPHPFNFSAINNFAVDHAQGDIIVLLNNDTEVITPGWLEAMLEHALRPEVGAVGAKLYYPNGTIQHAGVIIGFGAGASHAFSKISPFEVGYFGQTDVIRNVSAVTAACLMTRKEVYKACGGLEEEILQVAYNDIDFCLRLREHGYLIVYTPYAQLLHFESFTRGRSLNRKEIRYFRQRHARIIKEGDPYYNVNLTRHRKDYLIRI